MVYDAVCQDIRSLAVNPADSKRMQAANREQEQLRDSFIVMGAVATIVALISALGKGVEDAFTIYAAILSWWLWGVGLVAPWSRLWQALLWCLPATGYGLLVPWLR